MTTPIERLANLKHKINGQSYLTTEENSLADDMLTLIDIVADLAVAAEKANSSARLANHQTSCLANGGKPN